MVRPADWIDRVKTPLSANEPGRLRVSLDRSPPDGADEWAKPTASELRLEHNGPYAGPAVQRDETRAWKNQRLPHFGASVSGNRCLETDVAELNTELWKLKTEL